MKFSISLPTGFEGVMYPIPFVDPSDFVRMAKLCEKLGYHSVWGNDHITSQAYVRALYPDRPPNFCGTSRIIASVACPVFDKTETATTNSSKNTGAYNCSDTKKGKVFYF